MQLMTTDWEKKCEFPVEEFRSWRDKYAAEDKDKWVHIALSCYLRGDDVEDIRVLIREEEPTVLSRLRSSHVELADAAE